MLQNMLRQHPAAISRKTYGCSTATLCFHLNRLTKLSHCVNEKNQNENKHSNIYKKTQLFLTQRKMK